MSRLDELIQELCPDGVEHLRLGDISSLITKQTGFDYTNHIKSSLLLDRQEDCVPYIQTKFFSGKVFDYNTDYYVPRKIVQQFPKIALNEKCLLFSIVGASIGNVGLFPGDVECFLGGAICVAKIQPGLNVDYIYYCIESNVVQRQIRRKTKGAGQATITVEDIRDFVIPYPPIQVQNEIVRILDVFSKLTTELTTKLTAEIAARKKQYEYYQNKFLMLKSQIPRVPLNDITVSISSGKSKERLVNGQYSVYGSTGIISRTNVPAYDWEQILVARVGANAGFVHIANGQYDVSDNTLILNIQKDYLLKYIYYVLLNMDLNQYAKGAGQPLITAGDLKKIMIPMPEKEIQNRIVSTLDDLHMFYSGIEATLSSEIDVRRKQYEYYRDHLFMLMEV